MLKIYEAQDAIFPDAGRLARALVADPTTPWTNRALSYLWFSSAGSGASASTTAIAARGALLQHVARAAKRWTLGRDAAEDEASKRAPDETREVISQQAPSLQAKFPASLNYARHLPPRSPYDVFMAAAYLVEAAGIYHHIQPQRQASGAACARADHGVEPPPVRPLAITADDLASVTDAATAWREIPLKLMGLGNEQAMVTHLRKPAVWSKIAPLFHSWLVVFGAYGDADVFLSLSSRPGQVRPTPRWWFHAWRLLAISDEAARGTGFVISADEIEKLPAKVAYQPGDPPWFEVEPFAALARASTRKSDGGADTEAPMPEFMTLSAGRREIGAVLPKVRTPAVGCTLRSLTHHLALLPPLGVARGKWNPSIKLSSAPTGMPKGQMNLLLVPFPYSVDATAFCGAAIETVHDGKSRYGYFDVHQDWLRDEAGARREAIVAFLADLVSAARDSARAVNGVIFPELSLDSETYQQIKVWLQQNVPEIELLVAGVSNKALGRKGNFVAVTSFHSDGDGRPVRVSKETLREKHHRWKLDAEQLRNYGLQGVLSPEVTWWENIQLLSRRVDFSVLRKDSVLAALICEDLARVDPCQFLLRAVAPNLVIGLLMDAPQVNGRWPARYATVLAEDPGCAVLTLTSRALMTRQHRLGVFSSRGGDRYVAMWREGESAPRSLDCPYDAQALLLTLVEKKVQDISLDGRTDSDAKAWSYAGHVPVRVPTAKTKHAAILGAEDLACW